MTASRFLLPETDLSKQVLHQLLYLGKVNNFNAKLFGINLLIELGYKNFFKAQFIGFRDSLVYPAYSPHFAT